jgi:predicted metal-dependent HD superfamily phosphohydrolase
MTERERWLDFCCRLGIRPVAESLWTTLATRYGESHRAYHNLSHVADCLAEFDGLRDLAADPDALELAIWFHDAIYDPHAPDNELRSAELMLESLAAFALRDALLPTAYDLIIATKHDAPPETDDDKLMIDIDLAILGKPQSVFLLYEQGIRREYDWVAEKAYRAGRSKILQMFLDRERIYHTPSMHARYEAAARVNLRDSIDRLASEAR